MPLWMMTFGFWEREVLLVWQVGRAPIVAAAVALAAWLLGRLLQSARLQAAAGGLALCAGWAVALGLTVAPRMPAERLPMLAAVALAAGVAVDLSGRVAGLAGVLLAIAGGWWLAGAPHSDAAAGLVLPEMACLALAVLLALRVLRAPRSPWSGVAAALALWGALAAAKAPGSWTGLALVLLVAGLGQVGAPRGAAAVRLPVAAGLAGLAGLAVLALGRLGRGGVSRLDLAALAPLLAIWATPRLAARLPWLGGVGGALAAATLAVAVAWGGGRLGLVH
jgi:hypothetical protein